MKIIVVNGLSARGGGGITYLLNFFEYLPEGDFKIVFIVSIQNKNIFKKYQSDRVELFEAVWASKSVIHRSIWEYFILPSMFKKHKINIYYAPGGVMLTKVPKGVVSLTAFRNMLPFDDRERKRFPLMSYNRFKLWLLRFVFLHSYKTSDGIVFISKYSRLAVKKYIPDIDSKSTVIPHGVNQLFLNTVKNYRLPDILEVNQFYLYVSNLNYYKAQKQVIQAWNKLNETNFLYPLVLVGELNNEYGNEVIEMISELKLENKVFFLGKKDYEELPGLYQAARALIFASSCECCPNILLEKLASKRPILCSDIQPMPEFGQDAVVYFNPYSSEELVEQINLIEEDKIKMKKMAEKAERQALKFNWKKSIDKTVEFLFKTEVNKLNMQKKQSK